MRLTRLRLRRLAVPAAVLAVALPAAAALGPAHAAAPAAAGQAAGHKTSITAADPGHDVWFVDEGFRPLHKHIDGSRAKGDITSIKVDHTVDRVNVRLSERSIPKPRKRSSFEDALNPTFLLKTSAPQRFLLLVFVLPNAPAEFLLATYDGDFIDCSGLRVHVGFRSHRVRASIPRTCLGNPVWVKAQAATTYQFAQSFERTYVDVAPGRRLQSRQKTPPAYAPAGAVTRAVAPRMARHHKALPADLAALLRTLHFLR